MKYIAGTMFTISSINKVPEAIMFKVGETYELSTIKITDKPHYSFRNNSTREMITIPFKSSVEADKFIHKLVVASP